jgi:hypothetical protein
MPTMSSIAVSHAASFNLAVRFGTELAALTSLAFWGYQLGGDPVRSSLLAAAFALVMAAVWAAAIAPKASRRLPDPTRLVVEAGVFALATAAIAEVAGTMLATGYALLVTVNIALMVVWRQRRTA